MNKLILMAIVCLSASLMACETFTPSNKSNKNTAVVQNSNQSLIDTAADAIFGTDKTGIPECDTVLATLEKQMQNPNETTAENLKRQAAKQLILSQFREKSGVGNMSAQDKAFYGKQCKEYAAPYLTPSPAKK